MKRTKKWRIRNEEWREQIN